MSDRTTLENMMGDDNTVADRTVTERELLARFVTLQMESDMFLVLVPASNHDESLFWWDVCNLDILEDGGEYDDSVVCSETSLESAVSATKAWIHS